MVNEPFDMTATTEVTAADRPGSSSPPMAVLPLNPSAKLDQEPNPFEQSFSTANSNPSPSSSSKKLVLPPVAAITSPVPPLLRSGVLPKDVANQFAWDSLRTGPLSPSMLPGPTRPSCEFPPQRHATSSSINNNNNRDDGHARNHHHSASSLRHFSHDGTSSRRSGSLSSASSTASSTIVGEHSHHAANNRKRARADSKDEDDEKRRNFLERNRIAALKCRQRKKKWLNNLQTKVECLASDNEQLQVQAGALREEIVHLKALLLAHKDCPVATANNPSPADAARHHRQQPHMPPSSAATTAIPHHQSSIMPFPVTASSSASTWRY